MPPPKSSDKKEPASDLTFVGPTAEPPPPHLDTSAALLPPVAEPITHPVHAGDGQGAPVIRAAHGKARVCHESNRAVEAPGCKRFRVRAVGESPVGGGALKPVGLYVLAPDRAAAEACYLDAEAPDLTAAGFTADKRPHLSVQELPD